MQFPYLRRFYLQNQSCVNHGSELALQTAVMFQVCVPFKGFNGNQNLLFLFEDWFQSGFICSMWHTSPQKLLGISLVQGFSAAVKVTESYSLLWIQRQTCVYRVEGKRKVHWPHFWPSSDVILCDLPRWVTWWVQAPDAVSDLLNEVWHIQSVYICQMHEYMYEIHKKCIWIWFVSWAVLQKPRCCSVGSK